MVSIQPGSPPQNFLLTRTALSSFLSITKTILPPCQFISPWQASYTSGKTSLLLDSHLNILCCYFSLTSKARHWYMILQPFNLKLVLGHRNNTPGYCQSLHLRIPCCNPTTQILNIWKRFSATSKSTFLLRKCAPLRRHHPPPILKQPLSHISPIIFESPPLVTSCPST